MSRNKYYEHVRPELVEQIPQTARKILDVGCGSGQTGLHLKETRGEGIEVIGVEHVESVTGINLHGYSLVNLEVGGCPTSAQ